ncbi:DinB family protein [Foetidibacter luteolus]|uniref:DinB family protein n=1 Tax=Foetidibacter luteolus TaxID=2608880 RepID=UPI00129AD559|nr:DinB family protein [Foetidibacter luteolus]
MVAEKRMEVWMRGPIEAVPALLQPVAHALLQAREEVEVLMAGFDETLLWQKTAGLASPGFHLQHLAGVIDRLFTYARGEMLTPQQLASLEAEGKPVEGIQSATLVSNFSRQVDEAVLQLKQTDALTLAEARGIGRKQIPTTVAGLLFHAAEHTMRHVGQLLVTVAVLKDAQQPQ